MRIPSLATLAFVATVLATPINDGAGLLDRATEFDMLDDVQSGISDSGFNFGREETCTFLLYDTAHALVMRLDFKARLAPYQWAVRLNLDDRIQTYSVRVGMSPDNKRMEQCIKFVDGANTVTLCLRGPLASPTIKSWYLDSFYTPQTGSDWTKIVRPTFIVNGNEHFREFTTYNECWLKGPRKPKCPLKPPVSG